MPRSLFAIAFDHLEECPLCDVATRKRCPTGRALLDAAHDACVMVLGLSAEVPKVKA